MYAGKVNRELMHDPGYFSVFWLLAGVFFLLFAVMVVVVIIYLTRKRQVQTLSTLHKHDPRVVDLDAVRKKYLSMISDTERRYNGHIIKASFAHQELSLIIRLFYAEANGFHAEYLTLSDLKMTDKQCLTGTIEQYYPHEFSKLEKGSVADAVDLARKLIMNDEIMVKFRKQGAIVYRPQGGNQE